MNEEVTYFLHIPKSAGTTIQKIIERQYWPWQIYSILPNPKNQYEGVEKFQQIEAERYQKIRLVRGHYPYGIHQRWGERGRYFTFVREPISRVVSTYHYILRQPKHRYYELLQQEGMSLEKLLQEGKMIPFDNLQSRLLSGVGYEAAYGLGEEQWVEMALKNIDAAFSVVGLVERFDESLMLLQRAFGWRFPFYTKQNVGDKKEGISEEVRGLIVERNQFDIQLYQLLEARFAREVEQLGEPLQKELVRFQFWNQLFDPWQQRMWRTGRMMRGKRDGR